MTQESQTTTPLAGQAGAGQESTTGQVPAGQQTTTADKGAAGQTTGQQTPVTAGQAEPEKTFTQKELETIIGERLAREKKDLPSAEELTAFKKWQDGQKTEAEKQAQLLKDMETLKAEKEELELQTKLLTAGIPADMVKYAMLDIKAAASVEEGIKAFKEGAFFKSQSAAANVTFGVDGQKTGAAGTETGEKDKIQAAAYAAMGIKTQ